MISGAASTIQIEREGLRAGELFGTNHAKVVAAVEAFLAGGAGRYDLASLRILGAIQQGLATTSTALPPTHLARLISSLNLAGLDYGMVVRQHAVMAVARTLLPRYAPMQQRQLITSLINNGVTQNVMQLLTHEHSAASLAIARSGFDERYSKACSARQRLEIVHHGAVQGVLVQDAAAQANQDLLLGRDLSANTRILFHAAAHPDASLDLAEFWWNNTSMPLRLDPRGDHERFGAEKRLTLRLLRESEDGEALARLADVLSQQHRLTIRAADEGIDLSGAIARFRRHPNHRNALRVHRVLHPMLTTLAPRTPLREHGAETAALDAQSAVLLGWGQTPETASQWGDLPSLDDRPFTDPAGFDAIVRHHLRRFGSPALIRTAREVHHLASALGNHLGDLASTIASGTAVLAACRRDDGELTHLAAWTMVSPENYSLFWTNHAPGSPFEKAAAGATAHLDIVAREHIPGTVQTEPFDQAHLAPVPTS